MLQSLVNDIISSQNLTSENITAQYCSKYRFSRVNPDTVDYSAVRKKESDEEGDSSSSEEEKPMKVCWLIFS
jgi:hypothetical protein